jgi:hypothetical protein
MLSANCSPTVIFTVTSGKKATRHGSCKSSFTTMSTEIVLTTEKHAETQTGSMCRTTSTAAAAAQPEKASKITQQNHYSAVYVPSEHQQSNERPSSTKQLDPAKVVLGKRVGTGAFTSVYEATYEGSKRSYVVKRLDRVTKEHLHQVSYP